MSLLERSPVRLVVAVVLGIATYAAVALAATPLLAGVIAWIVLAGSWSALTWLALRRMSGADTKAHAVAEEPGRQAVHVILVVASLASLAGVGTMLLAAHDKGTPWAAIVGVAAVASSWLMVHLVFTTRYAAHYYGSDDDKPIDFGDTDDPDYRDFAYLAFTIGMTYQVSDTTLNVRDIRREALRQGLLAYLLGAVVIACTINLVVQLASAGN